MSKFIKKSFIYIIVISSVFSLFACDYWYRLKPVKNRDVVKIELIYYDNLKVKENPLEKHPFTLENLKVLENLSSNNVDSFIGKLTEIGGHSGKFKNVISSPSGFGIKMTYNDETFTIITTTILDTKPVIFIGTYDIEMNYEGGFGISWQEMVDGFKTLVNESFSMQIDWNK